MEKITRKGEVKSIVDDCLSTYQNGNVTDLAENLARTILSAKVKFPLLEFAAIKLHDAVSEEEQITFCKVIARLGAEGGNVLIGIILQKRLESHFEESIEVATSIMKSGQEWFITDIIGERVIGWALLNFPEKAIPRIKEIRNRESQWVVRSIGSGSHHAIKKGLEKRFVSEVFEVLLSLANSREHQVKTGIGWAAKTAAKFHPEIVKQYESRIQDPEKVGQWFRTKVRIGFERNAYPREIESKTILNKT